MTSKFKRYTILDDQILVEINVEETLTETEKFKKEVSSRIKGFEIAETNEVKLQRKRQEVGTHEGRIVAIGAKAFGYLDSDIPKVGDKIMFRRYDGMDIERTEESKVWYKLMDDQCALAIIREE